MTSEGTFPKGTGDILYASEANSFNRQWTIPIMLSSYGAKSGDWAPSTPGSVTILENFTNAGGAGPADGQYLTWKLHLSAGTYTLRVIHGKDTNFGIADFYIDATEVASIDMYGAAATYMNVNNTTGIAVADSGVKTVKLLIDGKNASSAGFRIDANIIYLIRTA